ncbi:MAG: RNA polymerase sigma factor [Pirellulales bacterium]|nr:RNA polymerase sigma factor [Pirellulales bacterium]
MSSFAPETRNAEWFAAWIREHGRAVRGYLLGMVRRADLADDLTQEVFTRAWAARGRYREEGHGRAYLLKIADRLLCDERRQRAGDLTLEDADWRRCEPVSADGEPGSGISARETAAELTQALKQLPPAQRRVLLLRYYGQMTFAEIAKMTESPLGTVLSHCRRGLEALRRLLVDHLP